MAPWQVPLLVRKDIEAQRYLVWRMFARFNRQAFLIEDTEGGALIFDRGSIQPLQ